MSAPEDHFGRHGTAHTFKPDKTQVTNGSWHGSAEDLHLLNPADWEGVPVPRREWIVPDMIPAKTVSLLFGDGGTGKSTLALQLAAARALKRQWLSTTPTPGRTLYISAEDDADELHRRLDDIRRHHGVTWADLADMRLVDLVGKDAVLGKLTQDGTIKATELFARVVDRVRGHNPDLVIVDALADSFAGDEISRAQARQYISLLKKPGREYGCAFLALAHPSLSGMNTKQGTSGSTAWSNSVRSRLYFARASDDTELRTLTVMKANYGPDGRALTMRWRDGVYIPETSGTDWLTRDTNQTRVDDLFLRLLARYNANGQNVSHKTGTTYAPAMFAQHPMAEGVKSEAFTKAMQRLLDAGRIEIETSGPPSRRRSHLAVGLPQ